MPLPSPTRVRPLMGALVLSVALTTGGALFTGDPASATPAPTNQLTWSVASGDAQWTVPPGVCAVTWTLRGGAGGRGGDGDDPYLSTSRGGLVVAEQQVTTGQQFVVQAGSAGQDRNGSPPFGSAGGTSGAQPSGGASGKWGAGGGGASVVRSGTSVSSMPVVVAGGGGGGGWYLSGMLGGAAGTNGSPGVAAPAGTGGAGGTTSTPGSGGTTSAAGPVNGQAASGMLGGSSATNGGGGGGGHQGGGAGASYSPNISAQPGAGGGGGANFVDLVAAVQVANGTDPLTNTNGSVSAVLTGCPALDSAANTGSGQVQLTFHDGVDDGVVATGYEYSTDGGTTWTALPVDTLTRGAHIGTVPGLTPGPYSFLVRATTGGGPTGASASVSATVAAPLAPVGTPENMAAAAGASQVCVTWAAPSSGATIDHYLVTLSDGRTITTPTLSVLFGADPGTVYTASVVAVTADGRTGGAATATTTAPSTPSVPASAPETALTLTTDQGTPSTVDPGQQLVVIGTGFLPFSTATIVIYSEPTVLGTALVDANGNFSKPVTVPTTLAAGTHSLVATGVAPDGTDRFLRMDVTVGAGGSATSSLAYTGADTALPLTLGVTALLAGAGVLTVARRRRA